MSHKCIFFFKKSVTSMLETKCVGDNYKMLVTVLAVFHQSRNSFVKSPTSLSPKNIIVVVLADNCHFGFNFGPLWLFWLFGHFGRFCRFGLNFDRFGHFGRSCHFSLNFGHFWQFRPILSFQLQFRPFWPFLIKKKSNEPKTSFQPDIRFIIELLAGVVNSQ